MPDEIITEHELDKARPPGPGFTEIGITGLKRYGNYIDEEFLPALRGTRAIKVYKEMSSNDATVGAMLFAAEQLIRSAVWTVEPGVKGNEATQVDIAAAEFLKSCLVGERLILIC